MCVCGGGVCVCARVCVYLFVCVVSPPALIFTFIFSDKVPASETSRHLTFKAVNEFNTNNV